MPGGRGFCGSLRFGIVVSLLRPLIEHGRELLIGEDRHPSQSLDLLQIGRLRSAPAHGR